MALSKNVFLRKFRGKEINVLSIYGTICNKRIYLYKKDNLKQEF